LTRKPDGDPSPREAGLRWLAASSHDRVEATLQHAFQELHRPINSTKKSAELRTLVDGVATSMPGGKMGDQRAKALWRLIQDEVCHLAAGDERTALTAAMHLDPTNSGPSIDKRLTFTRDRGDFGTQPSGKPHGYDAIRHWWGVGVRLLGHAVDERLDYLRDHPSEWLEYFNELEQPTYRSPSPGAQPIFADLFITTVFMRGRFVHRRITERVITAQRDGVEYYTARALPENDDNSTAIPVRAIWGCAAERVPSTHGEPILTRLWFPAPLARVQRHYFSSEAIVDDVVGSPRLAVNVEIDHHGIAQGRRLNSIPVSGLTIRVRFAENDLPDACWWYADVTERERYVRPDSGDGRWLDMTSQGTVEHTFVDPCQPLANYGIAFSWPRK
jgi:hypothetical protein